ncbi:MAG: thioredoxin family protein [Methylococcales bacterium]|nr:thioredoxin family protein [Methylococcales bacterium]
MKILHVLFIALLMGSMSFTTQAADSFAATDQVKVQLIASVDGVHSGDEILVGVQQLIIPHWHTYWKNSGDSGLPTTIDYELPKGATVSDILWPVPEHITLGPVTNYGYSHEVILLSKLKIPSDAVIGSAFAVKAKVKWLVCKEECIPQEADLQLDLPVLSAGVEGGHGSPLIANALAALPLDSPWQFSLHAKGEQLLLNAKGLAQRATFIKKIQFYPDEWGKVVHSAAQIQSVDGDSLQLQLKSGDAPLTQDAVLSGILAVTKETGNGSITRGYSVTVPLTAAPVSDSKDTAADLVLSSALLLALLGGLILNLMPCVFPVLSIKALSLIQHADKDPLHTRLHGWAYTAGIQLSFLLLGVLLIALKSGGAEIGWGFQFQSPLFVLLVAYLMFAVGLSLSGVFTIGGSIMGVGSNLANRSGYSGSFFTGVLASIVATPCTAPFMGAALGFALTQPPLIQIAVLQSLGFGLALPYLLLSHWPSLQRRLPKPGLWMERLKQGFAFPMYAASVWLVWVLAQQAGINAVAVALAGMVAIAFAAWLYEATKLSATTARFSGASVASVFLLVALLGGIVAINTLAATAQPDNVVSHDQHWEAYSAARLKELRAAGKPVFVNFTAAWCISCLVNEKVALSQQTVIDTFKNGGITYLKGDWTNRDAEITHILADFDRSGVPLYLFYPAGTAEKPVILPQILTPEIVTQTVSAIQAVAVINQ